MVMAWRPFVRLSASVCLSVSVCNIDGGHFGCLKLLSYPQFTTRFNCDVFKHKSESAHDLWFKLYCQTWIISQGHRQSRTLQKWYYLRNGAR